MKRINILFVLLLATLATLSAENIRFTATGPGAVVKGEQFRLVYSVNGEARDLRAPDMPNFEVLMGPSKSSYSSMQIVNGNMTSEVSNSFTFILMAAKEGTYTIPSATVTVNGKKFTSNAVTVRVLPPDKASAAQQTAQSSGGHSRSAGSATSSSSAKISGENLFARLILSSHKIYEQQYILATIKIYTRYDVQFEDMKFPQFDGFLAEEVNLTPHWTIENVNGVNYNSAVVKQTLLFPQRAGNLKIGSCKFNAVVRLRNQGGGGRSIFDDFFETYQDVRKVLTTQPTSVDVMPLPAGKPVTFNGAVGDFNISSSITRQHVKANEAVTVKVVISGNGNLKLLKNPEIKFPADFEVYDPKVTNKFKTTTSGTVGSKVIEYLAIPRFAGNYTVPGVAFTYFDSKSRAYKTTRTPDFRLQVDKGVGGSAQNVVSDFTNKESLKMLGHDLNFIKTNEFELSKEQSYFFGSALYWLMYIIPFLLFVVLFIVFRKKAQENANLALMRTKKASKVATKRLKLANKYLHEKNKDAFYDEMLKATWGYLSDKLSIPVSELNKDNIENELVKYGAGDELIKSFREILDICEFARYAPAQSSDEMHRVYDITVDAIGVMEKIILK